MDKKLSIKLNGNRHVNGVLRGFDQFMNLVIDETVEMVRAPPAPPPAAPSPRPGARTARAPARRGRRPPPPASPDPVADAPPPPPPQVSAEEQNNIGMVVIRGNSVVMIEALEKLWADIPPPTR